MRLTPELARLAKAWDTRDIDQDDLIPALFTVISRAITLLEVARDMASACPPEIQARDPALLGDIALFLSDFQDGEDYPFGGRKGFPEDKAP